MEDRLNRRSTPFFIKQEDSTGTPPDNAADSPFSGDEAAEVNMPSPTKRRGAKKKVITVPIIDADGSRSKGEVYPPPDSWSWRKYGQKPIKGSPYPRGYYRCSSSKGCPARKQVERSRLDPTTLLITYCSEHNHQFPAATTKHHHHHPLATSTPTTPTTSTNTAGENNAATAATDVTMTDKSSPEECDVFAYQHDNGFSELAGELGWFSDVGTPTFMENTSSMVGSTWRDADVALMLPIREEDQSLFGDLGELPECSVVFRRYSVEAPCCGGTG
ncbi:PREDICTED: probable WRKY transcription factor 69 isoform X2 [Nicotiana attenuata]|uniref:probable WRKY transcription factor 69 isoform X2 n=1 Tax=Nicotiana attenuata TaxID=49451 RepID=UPI000904B621|nr:PREDICTED: probable WRKY transcription factor 69 isoform X2 [Nicotiana attenuata]